MISVLMSEGLAPSNGAKSQEPPRDASRSAKDEKFSSFMDSRDDPSEVDPKQENEVAAAAGSTATTDQAAQGGDKTALAAPSAEQASESAPGGRLDVSSEIASQATSSLSVASTSDAAGTADPTVSPPEEVKTAPPTIVEGDTAAVDATTRKPETADLSDTAKPIADKPTDADATVRTTDAETDLIPRRTEADPRLATTSETGAEPRIDESGVRTASDTRDDAPLKFTDTPGQSSGEEQPRPAPTTNVRLAALDSDTVPSTDKLVADDFNTGELADLNARKQTVLSVGDEKLVQVSVAREAAPLATENLLAVAPASGPSAPAPVSTSGLAPTIPTHVIAAPNELTSVVMNALKNGGDVQEQLVVQLDPPELGRVLIDFKFDAQGLQQITVTSENPEALKRLRELHFELTQALKDQGFSDSNLSFQQEAQDQSQSNWQAPEWARAQSQVVAAAERSSSASAMPTPPNFTGRDRLDLLL